MCNEPLSQGHIPNHNTNNNNFKTETESEGLIIWSTTINIEF